MEHQKIANLIDDTPNQPSKFRTRNWVETNDESRGAYNVNSQITITGAGNDVGARQSDERDKVVIFKNCAPFTNCINEIRK